MKENNTYKEITKGIFIYLLFFIFPLIFQLIFYNFVTSNNNLVKSITLLACEISLTIILVLLNKDKFKNKFHDLNKNKKEYFDLCFKTWLLGFIAMVISNLLINLFITNDIANNEAINRSILQDYVIYAVPAMGILGPICEELAFRASFKNAIKNQKIFIFITSFLFALAHIISSHTNPIYIFPYFFMGYALGYLYSKTDNVLCNISVHIFHNSLALLSYLVLLFI